MGTAPEGRSTTKARRDDATTSDATCGVSLPRPIAVNHNRQSSSPSFSVERDETDEAARSTPGNPSTSYKRDVDVLPQLCWRAKPGIVSEIRRLRSSSGKRGSTYLRMAISRYKRATDRQYRGILSSCSEFPPIYHVTVNDLTKIDTPIKSI